MREAPISGVSAGMPTLMNAFARRVIGGVVEDLADGKELRHRPDLGQLHPGNIVRCKIQTCTPGMEIERVVGVRSQEPVE